MRLSIQMILRTSIGFAAVLVFCSLFAVGARAASLNSYAAYVNATSSLSVFDAGETSPDALIPGETPGRDTESNKKIVYLTFDDGPSENTDAILSILRQNHIHATFFVSGMYPQYRHLIKKAYDEGNTIGLHTETHKYDIYRSEDTYFNDLNQIAQIVKSEIGFVPAYVRFPGGSSNTVSRNYAQGIMGRLAAELNKRGYQYYDWNADSTDAAHSEDAVDDLVKHATACNDKNVVLLCHDAPGKGTTVQALQRIIDNYRSRGYTFRGISRNSYAPHQPIAN